MRDSSSVSPNPDSEKPDWGEMRSMLAPQYLIREMNDNERTGLDFLIDCLENTSACSITNFGIISVKVDDEIGISLDVERTIRAGIQIRERMESHPSQRLQSPMIGPHSMERRLYVYVTSNRGTSRLRHPACVVSLASPDIPCTDDCAAFVLSAENGELTQIGPVSSAIGHAMEFARREEKEILTRTVEQELDRVMALSWNEMMSEHEGFSDASDLREVCADEAREALLNHDPELEWTGDPPDPGTISQRVLSRISGNIFDGRIDTD